jgi:tetratricopeptide (TPR) repeat protein
MQVPARALFAALLWGSAAFPVLLWALSLSSPLLAVRVAAGAETTVRYGAFALAALALGALLFYPPFLPTLRLFVRTTRLRLGTDLGPLREAQERLRHFESAAEHLNAGRILLQSGKTFESIRHLQRAVELDGEHMGTRYWLGLTLARAGDLRGAAEQLAHVVQRDPRHAFGAAMQELGVVLERGGAEAQAVQVLERHEREFGPNRRTAFHRARARGRLGDAEGARADLRAAAAAPQAGHPMTLEDELMRARARVALWRGGRT